MIRTLLFSTLYPSSVRPNHGIFVETRLRELLKSGEVETRVVAPVPWFPVAGKRFGVYGDFAATPRLESRHGLEVRHPRYFLPPKIGMNLAPYALALGALPSARQIIANGFDFDLIDAHYYYPDGVAAGFLAHWLGKPFVVTARGSDINLIAQYAHPRRLMGKTARAARASIGVSQALVDRMAELDFPGERLRVLRNGVDTLRFVPENRAFARERLGLEPLSKCRILLSVGNLVEIKGHDVALRSLGQLDETYHLVIVGTGPERQNLQDLASRLGFADRVLFTGSVDNAELKWWYSAADVLVLCSSREGWPNVLLEAMACGLPVIATRVGGVPEIVTEPVAGRLIERRDPDALAGAITALFSAYPDARQIRDYAATFDWAQTTQAQIELFKEITHA